MRVQVAAANQFFGPMPDEIAHSQRVLQAWEKAQAQGLGASHELRRIRCRVRLWAYVFMGWLCVCAGVAVVDGKLIEALHVDEAKRTLEIRKNLEALELSYNRQQ